MSILDCSYCSVPENEIWLPIKDYEESYMISSFGKVKSLARTVPRRNGILSVREKILRYRINNGYYMAELSDKDSRTNFYISILVWEAFGNKKRTNGLEVDHKDDIRAHNCIFNLQLLTKEENLIKRKYWRMTDG